MARQKNKWGDFAQQMPKWPGSSDESFVVKVEGSKQRILELFRDGNDLDLEGVGEIMRAHRTEKERAEAMISAINVELEAINQVMTDEMVRRGLQNFTVAGGDQFSLSMEPHVKQEDKALTRQWAEESGNADLLAIPWQTLNAMTKDRLVEAVESGESVEAATIPGTSVFMAMKIKMRKA